MDKEREICKWCNFWAKPEISHSKIGRCKIINDGINPPPNIKAFVFVEGEYWEASWLQTREDFGCNQFETDYVFGFGPEPIALRK